MPRKHIVILGAGISGLAAGWFIKKAFGTSVQLTILEKEEHAGGWVQTVRRDGFQFEQGPRSCRTAGNGHETLALVEDLGLAHEVIIPHQQSKNRFIYDGKGFYPMPKRIWEVPFNQLTKGWLHALWNDSTMPIRADDDESIHQFFSRRIGTEWTDRLIDPMVLGIYAGDARSLSIKSCFPLFDQWEQTHGSLLKGSWCHRSDSTQSAFVSSIKNHPFFSFKDGMSALPYALAKKLENEIQFGKKVTSLQFADGKVKIALENQEKIDADQIISTLPTYVLEPLLSFDFGLPYASVVSVHLGFDSRVISREGFGYLIPSNVQSPVMGCIWDSSIFPQHNQKQNETRLTVMLLGDMAQKPEEEIIQVAWEHIKNALYIQKYPQFIEVKKSVRAIPQYFVGYSDWKKNMTLKLTERYPWLTMIGSGWMGVSVNDCVAAARKVSQSLLDHA